MAEPETGMTKADMKRLLKLARKAPLNCAIGIGPDAAYGLLLLNRSKQPKAVETLSLSAVPDAKNTRWGTAEIDEQDPKLGVLKMNRAANGMARRLVKTLKGTGYSKVTMK